MDYSEKWGVSIEEAVNLALIDLKLSRDEVEVTVLEEPSRGFFGIGSKLAKVRVEKKVTEPEPVVEEAPAKAPAKEAKKEAKPARDNKEKKQDKPAKEAKSQEKKNKKNRKHKSEKAADKTAQKETKSLDIALSEEDLAKLQDVEDHVALAFLKDMTEKMGLKLDFKARASEDMVYLEMSGDDSRTVIGKRGQTLDAIQYLTSLVVNKDSEKYIKVVVDAENYRAKRQKTLEQLANRLAAKVIKTRKQVRLEPMNPYERKVIHATLQKNPQIVTRSEGEEPYRKVIIELKK